MRKVACVSLLFSLSGCATLNESMSLGALMGATAGGGAMMAAQSSTGNRSFSGVAMAAGVGAALGTITSYFTHKEVIEKRQSCEADATDMRFGDLPPSPFIVPKTLPKKGNR